MAEAFGANLQAVRGMAQDLGDIRAELSGIAAGIGDAGAATGSAKVASALHDFVSKSSDNRKKLDKLLDNAAKMLGGLADGATQVDTSLTTALTPASAPAAPAGGPR